MLPSFWVAELDDGLFYPVRLELLGAESLLTFSQRRGRYLRYLTAQGAEMRCQEERERIALWMQFQWEMLPTMVPYFPDWEGDEGFIEAVTGQVPNVSPSSDDSVCAWIPGYVCAYGTYHLVPSGQGETRDAAVSELAGHVEMVDRECHRLCRGPRCRLSQGQNLLYPMSKRSGWQMFRVWLRLIILLASLILVGRYALLQVNHLI